MPPKRKQPASGPAAKTSTAPRRSKLAKENNITAAEEAEITEAFALFSQPSTTNTSSKASVGHAESIATPDLRRCLIALNCPAKDQAELNELLEVVDPDQTGWVDWEHFLPVAALKMNVKKNEDGDGGEEQGVGEEVRRAFTLFTKGEVVTLEDLRRVARELREEVPEQVLRDMIREAKGGELGGVGIEEFEGVVRRAGVFG